jgi:apolipoprotein N-acyltransferase
MNARRREGSRFLAFCRTTFGQALGGAVLLWAALPPLDLGWLGWIAPVPWVMLARRNELAGKHPYRALWLAGSLFWLAAYHWLRLPHPATSIGWVALSIYLALYLPIFVGLVRVATQRLRVPLILAAPIVWTGLEWARAHLLTGITLGSLGHTQYRWIALIQLSDLVGEYGVVFVVMFVAACLARMLPCDERPWSLWPAAPGVAVLAAALVYGHSRLAEMPVGDCPDFRLSENGTVPLEAPTVRIALVQGSIDSEFKADPELADQVNRHYHDLSVEAIRRFKDLDLIVWPETMCRETLLTYDATATAPPEWRGTEDEFQSDLPYYAQQSRQRLAAIATELGVPVLLGVECLHCTAGGTQRFNSAVLVTPQRGVGDHYNKIHRVMFGEYVPFADRFPWLQRLTPLPVSLTAGERPVAFEVGGLRLVPSICLESVLPHVIRNQVLSLREDGIEPDVLVNLTNDGWFWGSSELDMHLVCGVFRAVECRKPMLIAANTGFSAWIDADGRILARGPRRDTDVLLATVSPDGCESFYLRNGDVFAGACLTASLIFALVGTWGILFDRRKSAKLY